MIWFLLAAGYLLAALATSLPATAAIMNAGGYTSMRQLDREDAGLLAVASILWPLAWLAAGWYVAAKSYLRADTRRRLRGLGAEPEEGDPDRG